MLKKQALGLILMLSNGVSLLASSPNLDDYKQYLAANLPSLQLLMSLNSNDQAGFKNVAIVEYLLAGKAGVSYRDLLEADFEKKKGSLQGHLTGTSGSSVAAPAVVSATVDHLSVIIASTGFSKEAIRQRLLNNVVVLERLLAIFGQSYAESVNSSLFDKQQVLKDFGTTDSLLKILVENGFDSDQLVFIIKNSNEIIPTQVVRHVVPIISAKSVSMFKEFAADPGDAKGNDAIGQRMRVLELIKVLTPELYDELVKLDSTGERYITANSKSSLAAVGCRQTGGHPDIVVSENFMKIPWNQQLFIMGHELGHWVLGHNGVGGANSNKRLDEQFYKFISKIEKADRQLNLANPNLGLGYGRDIDIKGKTKRLKGHPLPTSSTFDKAYMRDNEFEADRFAIINLGVNPDYGIAWMKDELINDQANRRKDLELNRLFSRTHPFIEMRIKQMEDLKRELNLGIKFPDQKINWNELIAGNCAQYNRE